MSITKLKAHRDGVIEAGIGVYLDVVKGLIAAIDEHVAENGAQTAAAADASLQAKIAELEQEVVKLRAQVATLTQAAEGAVKQAVNK